MFYSVYYSPWDAHHLNTTAKYSPLSVPPSFPWTCFCCLSRPFCFSLESNLPWNRTLVTLPVATGKLVSREICDIFTPWSHLVICEGRPQCLNGSSSLLRLCHFPKIRHENGPEAFFFCLSRHLLLSLCISPQSSYSFSMFLSIPPSTQSCSLIATHSIHQSLPFCQLNGNNLPNERTRELTRRAVCSKSAPCVHSGQKKGEREKERKSVRERERERERENRI